MRPAVVLLLLAALAILAAGIAFAVLATGEEQEPQVTAPGGEEEPGDREPREDAQQEPAPGVTEPSPDVTEPGPEATEPGPDVTQPGPGVTPTGEVSPAATPDAAEPTDEGLPPVAQPPAEPSPAVSPVEVDDLPESGWPAAATLAGLAALSGALGLAHHGRGRLAHRGRRR